MNTDVLRFEALNAEVAELRSRLQEAEDTLTAIRQGDVDALVVGADVYTLDSSHAATNKLRKDVLAQMEDAVLAVDAAGHVIFMNPAAQRQYGLDASRALGCLKATVFTETWADEAVRSAALQALGEHGVSRGNSVHRTATGECLQVESTISVLRDNTGATTGYLYVIRNISERIKAEQSLHEATVELARRERQFSTLVENSPDIFARLDRSYRHLYVSPVIERHTGLGPSHYLGKSNEELGMPPQLCAAWKAAFAQVFETRQIGRIKFAFSTIDGTEKVFDSRLIPEFDDDGSVESVLSIAVDVTEQEQVNAALQNSRARLQFTLESACIGDWELDLRTGKARHSLQHDQCFGYQVPIDDWGKERLLSQVHPQDRAQVVHCFAQCENNGDDLHFECRVIWPDGSVHWIEVHGSFYGAAPQGRRLLGIVTNTTERKEAEYLLREADRKKDEFLATLAHELRNPLAPIRNALQILRQTQDVQAQEKARSIIERQLRQMVHLVDDLLDVSRISQGKVALRLERVDIADVVQAAIETSRPLIQAGGHQLSVRLPATGLLSVEADVTRLSQTIANLLNNAAKYTPEGGHIEVIAVEEAGQAVVAVRDSGIGIPSQLLPRVFDMFAQADRTPGHSQGGLGIGLALVKRLVEMHGGSVAGHSDGPGLGSQFTIRLPLPAAVVDVGQHGHDKSLPPNASDDEQDSSGLTPGSASNN